MTRKENEPRRKEETGDDGAENLPYNPDISREDKEVLNNQSYDESKGTYFKDREESIDYEGEDLDIPEFDDGQFNSTRNLPDDSELQERPKESADDLDASESGSETIYKGKEAEKYKDPSEKTRRDGPGEHSE